MTAALGAIRFDLQAMTAKFEAGMKRASQDLGSLNNNAVKTQATLGKLDATMSGTAKKIGAAINIATGAIAGLIALRGIGGFVRQMNQASEAVDTLGKKAATLGMSVEDLSAWRFAAGESGVEFETLSKMVGKLQKGLGDFATTGKGPAKEALRRLGVDALDANGRLRPMSALLPEIARAMERLGSQGEKISLATALFGRSGGEEFVQFLEDSGGFMKNLADQTARAKALGVVFSDRQVRVLKDYNDALGRVKEAWLGVRVQLMTAVAPALTEIANRSALTLARIGKHASEFGTVLAAAMQKVDVVEWLNEPGYNVAANAIRAFIGSIVNLAWTELNTRIRAIIARVWTTAGVLLRRLLGIFGPAFGRLWAMISEFLGLVWAGVKQLAAKVGEVLASLVAGVAEFLGNIGAEIASAWREAGVELEEFNRKLQDQRASARAWVRLNVDNIARLAEKYRDLGDVVSEQNRRMFGDSGAGTPTIFQGMQAGLAKLKDQYRDTFKLGEELVVSFTESSASGFARALASGEVSFRKLGRTASDVMNGVLDQIEEMVYQFLIARAITSGLDLLATTFLGGGSGGASGFSGFGSPLGGSTQLDLEPFASGGRFTEPTLLVNSKGAGIMAERGPEWIVPEGMGGMPMSSGGGGTQVVIIDQRRSGARPEVSQTRGGDGRETIRVIIRDEISQAVRDGSLDRALGGAYGVRRVGRST